ncbi:MAG TPA: hypothetical protein VGM56_21655 [Byssovorax sp.]|jgi:hypothetical protein
MRHSLDAPVAPTSDAMQARARVTTVDAPPSSTPPPSSPPSSRARLVPSPPLPPSSLPPKPTWIGTPPPSADPILSERAARPCASSRVRSARPTEHAWPSPAPAVAAREPAAWTLPRVATRREAMEALASLTDLARARQWPRTPFGEAGSQMTTALHAPGLSHAPRAKRLWPAPELDAGRSRRHAAASLAHSRAVLVASALFAAVLWLFAFALSPAPVPPPSAATTPRR